MVELRVTGQPTLHEIQIMSALVNSVQDAPVKTAPNPRVGCVLVGPDGDVISQGIHGEDGIHHAEVIALNHAGQRAKGATAVVTLEPCSHVGRTGPCADALIEAGIARVVFGSPDTSVAAGGAEKLRAAGIEVVGGVCLDAAETLIEPWKFATMYSRPFVTLKIATTLDGYLAAVDGSSKWITGEVARDYVQHLRARVDAIVIGTNTAELDDPLLDVRLPGDWPQPQPYIIGRRELSATLRLHGRYIQIRDHDPTKALQQMFNDGMQHVLIEGGATLAAEFIKAELVDQLIWCTAPLLLGAGRSAISDLGITNISNAVPWDIKNSAKYGPDLVTELRPRVSKG
jgi:diaminohydroxyphosphoribosylaminopyrimidine deaminase/5-amino-6-(5-phosphoribosylamino)uracil reductase